jgi:membrane carboxypeptidase/penicillin-binding protein
MIMKGPSSLACVCEQTSDFYNPLRCSPGSYTNTVNISSDPLTPDMRPYTVFVPDDYAFDQGVCDELQFNDSYQPPFVSTENFQIVEEGMRFAVTGPGGTARPANLLYVDVAGKTGTAEYCDDIAWPLGLCRPGNWPAHAWFTAYAPYEDPQIIFIAFVYNGGEGSAVALPIVVQTMEAYYRLQNQRGENTFDIPPDLPAGALPNNTEPIAPQATPEVSLNGQ